MKPSASIKELLDRLNEVDESHEIEAKRSDSEVGKSALETISAFANEPGLGGGYLLFGVVEDSSHAFIAKGVSDPKKLEQEISTLCAGAFNRTVRPRVWTDIVNGSALVAAFIPEAAPSEKPVFIKAKAMHQGAFRRIGSTDQRCTEDDLRVLFQASSLTPYEDTVVDDATMADLDPEVIAAYRRSLIEENPATELRDATLDDLVQALGGARRVDGKLPPTVAGVLLFGKKLSLRRIFPGARVDYVRVPGTEWVPDPEARFESIEIREPLLLAFRRIYNAVVDDLPKSFSLEPGSPERRDRMVLPESAVREVLVNALTHRDYRVTNPTQVIRYQDRIEIRNAGYSLADADQLGEPGSFPRNMRIADVFREMRLAENKGTGITAVRRSMDRAGLTPPVFDSDRIRNLFIATLWMHNLISAEESVWLEQLAGGRVSDAQARALVVARRMGYVTNAILRDVSGLDTLAASAQLRQLRDQGLLEDRGKGPATHYILGARGRPASTVALGPGRAPAGLSPAGEVRTGGSDEQTGGLFAQTGGFSGENGGVPSDDAARLLEVASAELRAAVEALGGKPAPAVLRKVIVELCELRWWTPRELAVVLKRKDPSHLSEGHLSALVKEGALERRFPENLAHPQQAYRARQSLLPLQANDRGEEEVMPKTKERHFEDAIEDHLLASGGWSKGSPTDFDPKAALVPNDFFAFIEATQPALWAELKKQHGSGLETAVVDALTKALDSRGALDVLRHGFKFFGKKIDCAYFKPAHGMNPDILAKYAMNRLVVTRQVRFIEDGDQSVDLVLFVNGFPVATAELKNPLTNQTVQDAIKQYRLRDPRHALFQFKKRALVHFAVDPDLVYMTTRLAGAETVFLPFNRGSNGGGSNPDHESGYRTGYLWQEVWERDSFMDLLGRFLHLAIEEKKVQGKTVTKESVVFPRYHQLEVVRGLDAAARRDGAGKSYLIQHSAGSGKSHSLSWLAHRLASLHDDKDQRVFDSVVVVTDRRVLDQQLQDNIYQFEHKQGVVQKIDENSQQLADALTSATPIVITTLQKFPFVTEKIGKLPSRRYALIVDEAHSSQTGEGARQMKEVLAVRSLERAEEEDGAGEEDSEDRLVRVMQSRGRQKNLSFFAFTATPKAKTLEIFGERDAEGKPKPFHLYSMRQAIEEGFILDVLSNYTTYRAYYRLVKAVEDDPKVNKKKATSELARFMSLHPHNLAQKTQVMVEHFRAKVRHKIGGRAKAMVVASSRLHAVRYKQAFDKYIAERGYDIGVLVAFSGVVKDPDIEGIELTEVGMNKGIRERELPEKFDSDAFQVLLVANKYQTGFDQPLLHTMYVDKRLSGVQAVQTLSRLNRTAPGKEDTFVLDFVNDADEIQRSFQPYYEQTVVAETADPNQLYGLQHRLEAMQVFWAAEVAAFCRYFYAPKEKQTVADQAEMYRALGPAVDRFKALDEDKQDEFRNALTGYVRLYSFLAQVMPFADEDLEKLYSFARHLELKLPRDEKKAPLALDGDVALKYYRLDKINEGSIALSLGEDVPLRGPTEVGTRKAKDEEVSLSAIIEVLNERFGTEFSEGNALLVEQFVADAKSDQAVVGRAMANPLDNFELSMKPVIDGLVMDRMDRNQDIATAYFNESEFANRFFKAVVRRVYDEIRKPSQPPSSR